MRVIRGFFLVVAFVTGACGAPRGRGAESALRAPEEEQTVRIGVVHMRRVLAQSASGREAQRRLEADIAELNEQLSSIRQEVDAAAAAVDEARERRVSHRRLGVLAAAYEEAFQRGREAEARLRVEYERKQKQATDPLVSSIREIAARLGPEEGLSLILDASTAPYFGEHTDLTERVIAELDEAAAQASIEAELEAEQAPGDGEEPSQEQGLGDLNLRLGN